MMETLKWVLYAAILLTSIPVGMFLAKLCGDELKQGRKYFRIFLYVSGLLVVLALIFYRNIILILSFVYAFIIIGILFLKSRKIKK